MKTSVFALLLTLPVTSALADPFEKAEVTKRVNSVSLQQNQTSRPAKVGDVVTGQTAVKTGNDSRAELVFPDQTLTRIGSNAVFRFQKDSRSMTLDGGTMLFSAPKGEGGGQVVAGAVTAAVTGTNFLLYYVVGGDVKVVVLEGKVLVYLTKNPKIRKLLRAGQIVVVPAGADVIPSPYTIDLKHLITTSRLLEAGGFGPFPAQALINAAANQQQGSIVNRPNPSIFSQQNAQNTRNSTANQGPQNRPSQPNNRPSGPSSQPAPTPRQNNDSGGL